MSIHSAHTRRSLLKTGIASLAAASFSAESSFASWKAPGETRVILLGGDFYHNPVTYERAWRTVLGPAGWRLMFAQSPRFINADTLANADLFIVSQYYSAEQNPNLSLGWSPDGIVEDRPSPDVYMTDEIEDAIVDNVRRGMGLLSIHCSIWNPNRRKYLDILGVEKPTMHTKVQPAKAENLNSDHPITQGIEPFNFGDDEIFNAEMKPGQYTLLFNTTGEEQPINAVGGWCREEGDGRVVSLLSGHYHEPYSRRSYKEIMWRSAHWAMKKDIPVSNTRNR